MPERSFERINSRCHFGNRSISIWLISVEDGIRSMFSCPPGMMNSESSFSCVTAVYRFFPPAARASTSSSSRKERERFSCISPSTSSTFRPMAASALPRLAQLVDFPLPPLLLAKQIVCVVFFFFIGQDPRPFRDTGLQSGCGAGIRAMRCPALHP